jgi:hypothetical protein
MALLRAVDRRLDGAAAARLLAGDGGNIDACRALTRQRPQAVFKPGCSSLR